MSKSRGVSRGGSSADRQQPLSSTKKMVLYMNHFPLPEQLNDIYLATIDYGTIVNIYAKRKAAGLLINLISQRYPNVSVCFSHGNLLSTELLPLGLSITHDSNEVKIVSVGQSFDVQQVHSSTIHQLMHENGYRRLGSTFVKKIHNKAKSNQNILVYDALKTEIDWRYYGRKQLLTLIINPCYKVINKSTVWNFIERELLKSTRDQIESKIVGQRVLTVYNLNAYTVNQVMWNMDPFVDTFHNHRADCTMTYAEYYHSISQELDRNVREPMLKVTSVKDNSSVYLVPQKCVFQEIELRSKQLLPRLTSIKPLERVQHSIDIVKFLNNAVRQSAISNGALEIMRRSNMHIEESYKQVLNSTKLKNPYLKLAPSFSKSEQLGANFQPKLKDIYSGVKKDRKLSLKVICTGRPTENIAKFYTRELVARLGRTQLDIQYSENQDFHIIQKLTEPVQLQNLLKIQGNRETLIVCFLADSAAETNYAAIHAFGARSGHHVQCLDFSKFGIKSKFQTAPQVNTKLNEPVLFNIVRQITNKVGYDSWRLDTHSSLKFCSSKHLLFIGYDDSSQRVQIRGTRETVIKSTLAFVATYLSPNGTCKYHSETKYVDCKNPEKSPEYKICHFVLECLDKLIKFEDRKNTLVVVIRDGVCRGNKLKLISSDVSSLDSIADIDLAYLIVDKDIKTRFVASNSSNDYSNVEPGTVFKYGNLREDQFFLSPLGTNLSTSRPTEYTVLKNANCVNEVQLQEMMWCMLSMYQNWPGVIKIPSVVMYAHKLSILANKMNCLKPIYCSSRLNSNLYYL